MNRTIEFVPRIIHDGYDTPKKLAGVVRFCHRTGIREVQLVPVRSYIEPAWLPRPAHRRRCRELKTVFATLRRHGIEGTINLLRTFMPITGTGLEPIGFQQPRMDDNGNTNPFTPCPLDPVFLDYIHFFYAEYAKSGATKLFVDDDYRYDYICTLPGTSSCFCPLHIAEFNRRYPHRANSGAIVKACIDKTPSPLKHDWMEFKRTLYLELAASLRKVVHAVNPKCRLGLMLTSTENSINEARDTRKLVDAFAGDLQPLARPGQGWYSDNDRLIYLEGLVECVYQNGLLSPDSEIQAEIDSSVHTLFNKSIAMTLGYQVKATLACNIKKQSIWVFDSRDRIDADHPFAKVLVRNLPVFKAMARLIPDGSVMRGAQVAYNPNTGLIRRQFPAQPAYGPKVPALLSRLGIPYTFEQGDPLILTRDSFPLTRAEAQALIEERNLLIDCEAHDLLLELGLDRVLGVTQERTGPAVLPDGCLLGSNRLFERLSSSPLNGAAAGLKVRLHVRRAKFLKPLDRSWKALCSMMNASRRPVAPGILAARKGERRLAVLAYPFEQSCLWLDPIKQRQLQTLIAWLAGGTFPALVEGAPDVCPVVLEEPETGSRTISLINCSTMRAEDFILRVAAPLPASRYRVAIVLDSGRVKTVSVADLCRPRARRPGLTDGILPAARPARQTGSLAFSMRDDLAVNSFDVRTLSIHAQGNTHE